MSRLRHLTEKKMSEHMWIQLKWSDQYQLKRWTASSLLLLLILLLSRVFDHTVNGWPKYAKDVPEELRLYHVVHGDLSVEDDKIIYRNRLVASEQAERRRSACEAAS